MTKKSSVNYFLIHSFQRKAVGTLVTEEETNNQNEIILVKRLSNPLPAQTRQLPQSSYYCLWGKKVSFAPPLPYL